MKCIPTKSTCNKLALVNVPFVYLTRLIDFVQRDEYSWIWLVKRDIARMKRQQDPLDSLAVICRHEDHIVEAVHENALQGKRNEFTRRFHDRTHVPQRKEKGTCARRTFASLSYMKLHSRVDSTWDDW